MDFHEDLASLTNFRLILRGYWSDKYEFSKSLFTLMYFYFDSTSQKILKYKCLSIPTVKKLLGIRIWNANSKKIKSSAQRSKISFKFYKKVNYYFKFNSLIRIGIRLRFCQFFYRIFRVWLHCGSLTFKSFSNKDDAVSSNWDYSLT